MQLPSSLRSVTHRPSHAAAISPPGLGLSLGDDRGKPRLLGITKRGSKYLRKMLIQGARAGLPILNRCNTRLGQWLRGLLATAHCRPDPNPLSKKRIRIVLPERKLMSYDPSFTDAKLLDVCVSGAGP